MSLDISGVAQETYPLGVMLSGPPVIFPAANAPDFGAILTIRQGADGFTGFYLKGARGEWLPVASVANESIPEAWPGLAGKLEETAYFTVNTFYRTCTSQERHLRWLSACYVDIDCGRPESAEPGRRLPPEVALGYVWARANEGRFPAPSMLAISGRGAYAFWLLENTRAFKDKIATYKAVNRALVERLADLGADPQAIDAARVLRVPGTMHTKAGRRAQYALLADADGHPFTYELRELADALDVPRQTYRGLRRAKHPGTCPARAAGPRVRARKRLADIETWSRHIRGLPEGRRCIGLTIAAECCRQGKLSRADAVRRLEALAGQCRPPYPHEPADSPSPSVASIAESAYNATPRNRSTAGICKTLGITPEAAFAAGLAVLRPEGTPKALSKTKARQCALLDILAGQAGRPSLRALADLLGKQGIKAAAATVRADLQALEKWGML